MKMKLSLLLAFFAISNMVLSQESGFVKISGERSKEIKNVLSWNSKMNKTVIGMLSSGDTLQMDESSDFYWSAKQIVKGEAKEFASCGVSGALIMSQEQDPTKVFGEAEIHEYDFDSDGVNEIIVVDNFYGNLEYKFFRIENNEMIEVKGIDERFGEIELWGNFIKFAGYDCYTFTYNKDGFKKTNP